MSSYDYSFAKFFAALVAMSVFGILMYDVDDRGEGTPDPVIIYEDHTKDTKVERRTIEGHDYLMITRPEDNAFTAVHDPDCRCAHKTAEKEPNE